MRTRLPVVSTFALRRFEDAFVDQPLGIEVGKRGSDRVTKACLGEEAVVMDAEQREVVADQVHHHRHRAGAEQREPLAFGEKRVMITKLGGECLPDRDQIVTGVIALRDRDDAAERLEVAQMDRPRERIDLPASIVDVIFARHVESGVGEQRRQRIADHRPAAMPHVHRPGRVGRDIFDVDRLARPHRRAAIVGAVGEDRAEFGLPDARIEADVEEARPGDLGARDVGDADEILRDADRDLAGLHPRRLRQHHRGVGRKVAVGRIARAFDGDMPRIESRRQVARADEVGERVGDVGGIAVINGGQGGSGGFGGKRHD